MWKVVRENPRAVIYAVLMHLVLLALLMVSLDWTPTATKTGGTQPVQAELVDQKQLKAIEDRKLAEQRKAEQQMKQKAEAERKRKAEEVAKQKAETERKRKAEQAVKQKAEAERKRKADQTAKQKAEAERKRKADQAAKQKAEAERKRKAEQVAKQKAEAARQREVEQAMQAEIAAEQQAEKEARDQGVVAEHVAYIQEKVRRNWLRPAGSSDDFTCTLEVSLIPGGDVARARVVQSCGDAVLDRSVESAVFKAAPLPVPGDSGRFHYFRELRFVFSPG